MGLGVWIGNKYGVTDFTACRAEAAYLLSRRPGASDSGGRLFRTETLWRLHHVAVRILSRSAERAHRGPPCRGERLDRCSRAGRAAGVVRLSARRRYSQVSSSSVMTVPLAMNAFTA